eukprot:GHVU01005970.1.p1 GENE.GHVU01005970.1~~GHVU01005970.1.p1  ORF type:complete len:247 (-),score=53.72 GHVU01005970.1:1343-2083(-)
MRSHYQAYSSSAGASRGGGPPSSVGGDDRFTRNTSSRPPPPPPSSSSSVVHQPQQTEALPNWIRSLEEELDRKLLIVLRDGKMYVGHLRGFDQFGNLLMEDAYERVTAGVYYCDIHMGILLVRGDNICLFGALRDDEQQPHAAQQQADSNGEPDNGSNYGRGNGGGGATSEDVSVSRHGGQGGSSTANTNTTVFSPAPTSQLLVKESLEQVLRRRREMAEAEERSAGDGKPRHRHAGLHDPMYLDE